MSRGRRKTTVKLPAAVKISLSRAKVDWQAETIRLLKRVYPAKWEVELWNIHLRYLKQMKEKNDK